MCLVLLWLLSEIVGVRLSPRGDLICCGVMVPVVPLLLVDVVMTGDDVEGCDELLVETFLDRVLSVLTGVACLRILCGILGGCGGGRP